MPIKLRYCVFANLFKEVCTSKYLLSWLLKFHLCEGELLVAFPMRPESDCLLQIATERIPEEVAAIALVRRLM